MQIEPLGRNGMTFPFTGKSLGAEAAFPELTWSSWSMRFALGTHGEPSSSHDHHVGKGSGGRKPFSLSYKQNLIAKQPTWMVCAERIHVYSCVKGDLPLLLGGRKRAGRF